jgi:N-methylhydantoinase A
MPGENIEIVNFIVTIVLPSEKPILPTLPEEQIGPVPRASRMVYFSEGQIETPVINRTALRPGHQIAGPALVEETGSVTVICPRQLFMVDSLGNIRLTERKSERS